MDERRDMGVRVITTNARRLRRDSTPAERELWKWLRGRRLDGLKFRRQHPRGGVIHDFFCHEARLVVELDGNHHGHDFRHYANDVARDQRTASDGYAVLRFGNREVLEDVASVLARIRAAVSFPPLLDHAIDAESTPDINPTSSAPAPLSRQGEGPGER